MQMFSPAPRGNTLVNEVFTKQSNHSITRVTRVGGILRFHHPILSAMSADRLDIVITAFGELT
ncbi:MAG: hypothetical protein BWY63_00949 [Chloroflexi bacterium ADurb.Bin360]|nr:MAG: hypothetical protein BWY63_00949 [Chloroflexi bacterium ADurb.Bin360]